MLVFTNLLAHADVHGTVDIHPNAISDEVGLSVEEVKAALIELEDIDPESRSPENEGRRIVRLDGHRSWGWKIENYVKYRSIKNEDDRREQNREAQARWRNKSKQPSADISSVSLGKPMQKKKEKKSNTQETPDGFSFFWENYPKKVAKPAAEKAFRAAKINGQLPKVIEDIERRKPDWAKDNGQYIPYPATYLNKRRWEDFDTEIGTSSGDIWKGAI